MWKFLCLVAAIFSVASGEADPEPKFTLPGLPGMDIDLLPYLKPSNFAQLITGWGLFNLGTEVQKMIFTLRTIQNNYKDEVLKPEDQLSFLQSSWGKTQKTIIVIHGYAEDASGGVTSPTQKVADAYTMVQRPENIVFVDWRYLGRQLNYFDSANNTVKAGMRVAEFLIFLRNANYIQNLQDVHLVGFSLGAHVSAAASYYSNAILGEKIGRISGLDAAGPGFAKTELKHKLDESDATFVDVIHTNMGVLLTTFGTNFKSGHVDFYPNGGENQAGCKVFGLAEPLGVCSHVKAADYYANSILGKRYVGCPCADWKTFQTGSCKCTDGPIMGEFVDPSTTGDYYLDIPLGQ